jgi:hypothetical protein
MHRIRSGEQTITVTVPHEPLLAGIDPHHLLDWVEDGDDNNIEVVSIERAQPAAARQTNASAQPSATQTTERAESAATPQGGGT